MTNSTADKLLLHPHLQPIRSTGGVQLSQRSQQFMKIDLSEQFDEWTRLLHAELAEILEPIGREPRNYGFALAVPEDAGSACLMYAVGNESKLVGEEPGSDEWLDLRYSAVEWVQNAGSAPAF